MSQKSRAQLLAELPADRRAAFVASLNADELAALESALESDWGWIGRPSQQIPPGDWIVWMILAGRGFGKTRTGVETVRQWVKEEMFVNLIGATADDARDIMIEGESGILAKCPKDERPLYQASKRRLVWPNGAISLVFTADEPERLRGKQHAKIWADELAAWRYEDSWDQAMFGLRLGKNPQAIVTTTPLPTPLVRALSKAPTTIVTRGSTFDNSQNLAKTFLSKIVEKYEGTRLGRQELHAEILDDNPGALWKRSQIDATRITSVALPDLAYIAVGVDPSVTRAESSDEKGIVAIGKDDQDPPHYYVLDDRSLQGSPQEWAKVVVAAYAANSANMVVGEVNQGGEMVEATIRTQGAFVPFKAVRATKGKAVRAEPVSALYEQGRVHHVGAFGKLEDQMCEWDPLISKKSPDRVDAMVWAFYGVGVTGNANPWLAAVAPPSEEVIRAQIEKENAPAPIHLPAHSIMSELIDENEMPDWM